MSVSIRKAFKNVFSEKYNKVNLLIYCLLYGLYAIGVNYKGDSIISFIINLFSLILIIPISGTFYLSYNNSILDKKNGIVPNLFKDFIQIFTTGLINYFGSLFSCIVFMFFPIFVSALILAGICFGTYLINKTLFIYAIVISSILLIGLTIFLIIKYICLSLNAYMTLEFNDWFNWNKATKLYAKTKKELGIWFVKCICIDLIGFIFLVIICLPAGILMIKNSEIQYLIYYIAVSISSTIFTLFIIPTIELTAQLLQSNASDSIQEAINQKSETYEEEYEEEYEEDDEDDSSEN